MGMKICCKCGEVKELDEFYTDKRLPDGKACSCKVCDRARAAAWRKSHPERAAEIQATYWQNNLEVGRARCAKWEKENPERRREINRRWETAHPEDYQVSQRKAKAKWDKEHPDVVNAKTARHRARKLCATPAWANDFFIEEAYALAKLRTEMTGIKWEVDHIVPLNSKKVCGLHVENNLRVIPKVVNRAKSNRYWPDMPESHRVSAGQ